MLKLMLVTLIAGAVLTQAAPRILVHGHRGARAMRPENTIPAFEYASRRAPTCSNSTSP